MSTAAAVVGGFGPLRHVVATGSTNDDLVGEVCRGIFEPALLVADHQDRGRGRLQRVWEADAGAHLLMSLRLETSGNEAAAVAAVAAAARRGAAELIPVDVLLKWPNDLVVIDGPAAGKLAGVLAELVTTEHQRFIIVGVGVNVGPTSVSGATSLSDCGGPANRDRLLAGILKHLRRLLDNGEPAVWEEARRYSATLGTLVRVEMPGRDILGTAMDLDDSGRLLVDDGSTVHVVAVGDVVHLRSQN